MSAASDTAPLATAEGDVETEMPQELKETVPEAVTEANAETEEGAGEGGEGFCVLESAPAAHRFRLSMLQPSEPKKFYSAVKREIKLLKSDLPPGVSHFQLYYAFIQAEVVIVDS